MKNCEIEKSCAPRPDFEREIWESLDGSWQFGFEEERAVSVDEWIHNSEFPQRIIVPFVYQTELSEINDSTMHEVVWYKRWFDLPGQMEEKTVLLKFGAVDYVAEVWLNGTCIGSHEGGYTPFEFDITDQVKKTENQLVVRVTDRADTTQPRGKQFWKQETDRCWYIQNTGIWQHVWLEGVEGRPIDHIKLTPDIDSNSLGGCITVEGYKPGDMVRITVSYREKTVKTMVTSLDGYRTNITMAMQAEDFIDEIHYWTPEHPNLYDVVVELLHEDKVEDRIHTYFGMRKISIDKGRIMLNHMPYYLKMVLDQGYWKESQLTPPSDEALRRDIERTKAFGFNGARKHQKIEDPRYYYWADRLGLLVWGEVPSAYEYCDKEIANITRDFMEFLKRDYNHPCIMAWVPLNESWGVRKILTDHAQQSFGQALYHLSKSMDQTRIVSTNDGWENVNTDIVGIHDYHKEGADITKKYTKESLEAPEGIFPSGRRLFAYDVPYLPDKSAFMVTEYGGIALTHDVSGRNWGYGDAEVDEESLIERYQDVTDAIMDVEEIVGFCYTQLTDVYQEVNGLMDMNHEPKVDVDRIKAINDRR